MTDLHEMHSWLVQLRHKTYAHTDSQSGRTARLTFRSNEDGAPEFSGYGESWRPMPEEWMPTIINLAVYQQKRFRAEARDIGL